MDFISLSGRWSIQIQKLPDGTMSSFVGRSQKMSKPMKIRKLVTKFTFFFLDGAMAVLEGETAAEAMKNAGYTQEARTRIAFYSLGDDRSWEFQNDQWYFIGEARKKAG